MGDTLYVSMCDDFSDEDYLKTKMDELTEQLRLKDVIPSELLKQCPTCDVTDKEKITHSLCVDGKYCTFCSTALMEIAKPKNFCENCNIHVNGRYCSECQQDLIDETMKIRDIQDEYRKHIPLKFHIPT